jgi:hypothetical protein
MYPKARQTKTRKDMTRQRQTRQSPTSMVEKSKAFNAIVSSRWFKHEIVRQDSTTQGTTITRQDKITTKQDKIVTTIESQDKTITRQIRMGRKDTAH